MRHSIRRDPPGSIHLTPLDPGIPHTPTTPFDPVAQRDAARANADLARRCHYLKPSGERCGSPAMRGFELCYYHDRYQPKSGYRNLPCLEDAHSVQCAIQEIIEDMLNGMLDYKKAALALYGLQTAASNLKQMRIAENDRRESEEKQMNRGMTQGARRDLDSPAEVQDEVEEIELVAASEQPATGHGAPGTSLRSAVHGAPSTPLIESPRPPQHVTRGLRTQAERRAMAQRFPDMKKIRAEFLASLTPEERAQVEHNATSCLPDLSPPPPALCETAADR